MDPGPVDPRLVDPGLVDPRLVDSGPWTLGWTGECLSTLLPELKIGYRKRMIVDTIGTRTRSR